MTPLTHMGVGMTPEPVNVHPEQIVDAIRDGDPVVVILEPGDATRYHLLIVPAWADKVRDQLGAYGIPVRVAEGTLIVTKLSQEGGNTFWAQTHVNEYDLADAIQNEWSRILLSWWLREYLWPMLRQARVA